MLFSDKDQEYQNKKGFTTGEVAEICHVTIPTVIKWIDSGELEGFKIPGSKNRRITRESLLDFMKKYKIPTTVLEKNKIRVLIVDDRVEILDIIDSLLDKDKYETRLVSKGFEAGIAKEFQPDLIILDILLPDIDGRKVCEYIREMPEMSHVAILGMSGYLHSKEELDDLWTKGFDDFILKPFDYQELLEKVKKLILKIERKHNT